jgi:hypothetical protein
MRSSPEDRADLGVLRPRRWNQKKSLSVAPGKGRKENGAAKVAFGNEVSPE